MKEMISTIHPEKKKGVNISNEKYEIIRKAILATLNDKERNDLYGSISGG